MCGLLDRALCFWEELLCTCIITSGSVAALSDLIMDVSPFVEELHVGCRVDLCSFGMRMGCVGYVRYAQTVYGGRRSLSRLQVCR
jgi:hypothetical protein